MPRGLLEKSCLDIYYENIFGVIDNLEKKN